jgi:hypothetical protein
MGMLFFKGYLTRGGVRGDSYPNFYLSSPLSGER